MIRFLLALSLASLLPVLVSAHGFVGSVTIDGKSYTGNIPGGATNPSVIRQVSTIDPVKGASNPSLNCGMNATLAANVASANPGSQIQVHWVGSSTGGSNWPHNTGPIMHYMTKCIGSCASYDSTNAQWFKISEVGLESGNTTWYQTNIMQGQSANVTIPSNIEPGDYLLRSEIISLQLAVSLGGAEFYPACIQLTIGGSGTGTATSSEECAFPGGYTDSAPGIYDPNVYNTPVNYIFPGPPVAAFVGSGGVQGGTQPSGAAAGGSSATPTGSSPTPSGSSAPANTSSPSSPASSPAASSSPTTSPSTTPSPSPAGNSTTSNPGSTCYVTSNNNNVLSKRADAHRGIHKRRLVRRSN